VFQGVAVFAGCRFDGDVRFDGARFARELWLAETTFLTDVTFAGATFEADLLVGHFDVVGDLELHDVTFQGSVQLDLAADQLDCHAAKFDKRVTLVVDWAEINLGDAVFSAPALVRSPATTAEKIMRETCRREGKPKNSPERIRCATRSARARLVSLQGAT